MIPNFVKERRKNGEGFDLYFAGTQCDECETWMLANESCRLQSQLNDRKNIGRWIAEEKHGKLFIDSGAYTAMTQGKEVDPEDYIEYINSISTSVYAFAQLDYIPKNAQDKTDTAEQSWQNYLYMLDRVKEPDKLVPIYHQSESLDTLRRMVNYKRKDGTYIPYIGFGALAGTGVTIPQKKMFFEKCFRVIQESENPHVKVHAMGMTSLPLLELYPFFSADSTGWIMTGAAGNIMTHWGVIDVSEKNQFSKTNLRHLQNGQKIIDWINSKEGLVFEELFTNYKMRMLCNLMYLTEWARSYKFKGSTITKRSLF